MTNIKKLTPKEDGLLVEAFELQRSYIVDYGGKKDMTVFNSLIGKLGLEKRVTPISPDEIQPEE